jgi:hypothetical protein
MSRNSDTSASGRIYYPGPGIVVTRAYIETTEGRYPIRDLIIEDPCYFYAYPARTVAIYCGAVEVLLAAVVAAVIGSAALLCLAGAVLGAGVAGAALIDNRRNPRRMELAAWHQGDRVMLFTSDNRRQFEQVRRAVVRAMEANRGPRP